MLRLAIVAILLCSQLLAPTLSGNFVCMAANGCVCVDAGPETCTCGKIQHGPTSTCSCGCHEESPNQFFMASHQDCTHIAVSNYEALVKVQESVNALQACVPVSFATYTPQISVASLARCSLLSDDSATLAVLCTVMLRI